MLGRCDQISITFVNANKINMFHNALFDPLQLVSSSGRQKKHGHVYRIVDGDFRLR